MIAAGRDVRDSEADTYDAHIGRGSYVRAIEEAWLFHALDLRGDETVLDAGCATGWHLERFLDEAREVVAVDHSQRSLELARERIPAADRDRIRFITADLRQIPIPDESVDAVVCSGVLSHIPTRRARLDIVYELRRVLRPGGVAVFMVDRHAFTRREFRGLLAKGGFSQIRSGGAVILPEPLERLHVSVALQLRMAHLPGPRSLGHYVVASAVRPADGPGVAPL